MKNILARILPYVLFTIIGLAVGYLLGQSRLSPYVDSFTGAGEDFGSGQSTNSGELPIGGINALDEFVYSRISGASSYQITSFERALYPQNISRWTEVTPSDEIWCVALSPPLPFSNTTIEHVMIGRLGNLWRVAYTLTFVGDEEYLRIGCQGWS